MAVITVILAWGESEHGLYPGAPLPSLLGDAAAAPLDDFRRSRKPPLAGPCGVRRAPSHLRVGAFPSQPEHRCPTGVLIGVYPLLSVFIGGRMPFFWFFALWRGARQKPARS